MGPGPGTGTGTGTTGMILPEDAIPSGQEKYFVPVVRDMTAKETSQHQIELY